MAMWWIVAGAGVLIAGIFWYYYNRFIILENRISNSSAQIDVQLRKRAELVPNLVKIAKGFAKHEKKIMEEVVKARNNLIKVKGIDEKVKAGDRLQGALGSFFAVAENYPQLRSNENFLQIQTELSAIEDKVAYSRQYYNDSILEYDNSSQKFPGVLFFRLYGKKRKEYLKISESSREMPEIDL